MIVANSSSSEFMQLQLDENKNVIISNACGPEDELNNNNNDDDDEETAWIQDVEEPSMPEVNKSVHVPTGENVPWWKTFLSFVGPGAMVAVGYMDPGNWSTDIGGGSAFGYDLLFVILLSSIMAMFLQRLAARCGLATGRDLAQCCRDSYPTPVVYVLWVVTEIAIIATDLAEVLGSAVAMKLLFGLPLIGGVCVTSVDVLILLFMHGRNFRYLEMFVGALVLIITGCFAAQLGMSKPEAIPLLAGFVPDQTLFTNKDKLFLAIGIVGATVMPHNLFLHSSVVLTRDTKRDEASLRQAIKYATMDSTVSLCVAWFVNSAILMVAASAFHVNGLTDVATLEEASQLLNPVLGNKAASVLFGIALLASGQNSTITGTLTGQIVMEGFVHWRISPVARRLVTRLLAIVPAIIAVAIGGDDSANQLLIISQVVLSFALPFAVFPLIHITSTKSRMGVFASSLWVTALAYLCGLIILTMNFLLFIPF